MQPIEQSVYDAFLALPDTVIGEILNGELNTQPRPGPRHALTCTRIGADIGSGYSRKQADKDGWWILDKSGIHINASSLVVPDLAGWRKTTLPELPETPYFETTPDWVCEVLSPGTAKIDRTIKLPIYANNGVQDLWLIDPIEHLLEAYTLKDQQWVLSSAHKDDDKVSIPPFDAISIALDELWG